MSNIYDIPQLPYANFPGGVNIGSVQVVASGANVIYLRSTGPQTYDDPSLTGRIVPTLSAALGQCRSGLVDTIVALPGHSESVTTTPTWVAGVQLIGIGSGGNRPVFRWTATSSQWALNVNDVVIRNCHLKFEGAVVVKAINITGTDCALVGNDIEMASGASNLATIGIEIGTAADRASIMHNTIRGTTNNVTSGIKLVGATPADGTTISHNRMYFAAASGKMIDMTVANTNVEIRANRFTNNTAASDYGIVVASAASTGNICDNYFNILNDGTASAQGISLGASSLIQCFNNQAAGEPKKSGLLTPVAAT